MILSQELSFALNCQLLAQTKDFNPTADTLCKHMHRINFQRKNNKEPFAVVFAGFILWYNRQLPFTQP